MKYESELKYVRVLQAKRSSCIKGQGEYTPRTEPRLVEWKLSPLVRGGLATASLAALRAEA